MTTGSSGTFFEADEPIDERVVDDVESEVSWELAQQLGWSEERAREVF